MSLSQRVLCPEVHNVIPVARLAGDRTKLRSLVRELSVDCLDIAGYTPLMYAVMGRQQKVSAKNRTLKSMTSSTTLLNISTKFFTLQIFFFLVLSTDFEIECECKRVKPAWSDLVAVSDSAGLSRYREDTTEVSYGSCCGGGTS